MHFLIIETRDVAHPVLDILADFAGLVEVAQDVRLGDAHVDAAQIENVLHILPAALADHRQDAQVVAVVEHCGDVVGDAEIGAVRIAGDQRHGIGVKPVHERVALGRGSSIRWGFHRHFGPAGCHLLGVREVCREDRAGGQNRHCENVETETHDLAPCAIAFSPENGRDHTVVLAGQ